jgi:hypothetical protein
MAVHRIAFSRAAMTAVQGGTVTCALRALIAAPGDMLLGGLPGQPPLVRLKVTGFRRGVPFLALTRRELDRAGLADPQARAEAVLDLRAGANPSVNVIHFRLMKR